MKDHSAIPQRFYSLDVLRGVAALTVVFWHWQHFFFNGAVPGPVDLERLPLYRVLFLAYTRGWFAVDLFFVLSGFVFYWLYSGQVSAGGVSAFRFAVLRFSRLYPLHVLTLLAVAVGQLAYRNAHGSYFVYPNNDAYHFALNLGFASSWGLERGYSFNGPAWSISVEIALYGLFFLLCRVLPVRLVLLAAIAAMGFLIIDRYYSPMGRGVGAFFLGGCVYLVYQILRRHARVKEISLLVAVFAVTCWAATLYVHAAGIELHALSLTNSSMLAPLDPVQQWIVPRVLRFWAQWILFPSTILGLVLLETTFGALGRSIAFLGDISYSSYLLHFPLQLGVLSITNALGIDRGIYYESLTMMCFFVVLLVVSFTSYHYFEVPLQDRLRKKRGLRMAFTKGKGVP